MNAVRTVYIELRASAERLRADMADASKEVGKVGDAGKAAGNQFAGGMKAAEESVGKVTKTAVEAGVAIESIAKAVARYSSIAAASGSTTEGLANTYRALRVALDPSMFTIATVAVGILAEKTLELVDARARLIEQQSLIAAKSGLSYGSAERADNIAGISGGNSGTIQSLQSVLAPRLQDSGAISGLSALGLTGDEPNLLAQIAKGFDSIEDPARRAAIAVQIFGAAHAEDALKQLTPAFADADATIRRFGLGLDSVSREQIDRFHRDMAALKRSLTDWSDVDAVFQKVKQTVEQLTAAFYSLATSPGWDTKLYEKLRGTINPNTLTPDELRANRRGLNAGGDAQQGLQADDLFTQAQGAHSRQSQTLEGRQTAQREAQARADAAYVKLNDGTQRTGSERLGLATEQQSAQALAAAIGVRIKSMQDLADAEVKAKVAAEQLATFQAGAGERLDALYRSSTLQNIKDPVARQIFEGRIEIQRDADKTTPEEKQGRAQIESANIYAAAVALQLKVSQEYLRDQAKAASDALAAFGKALQKATADAEKKAEEQRKIDAGQMESTRSLGEHGTRLAGIQSQPGDEAQLARTVLDLRMQTIDAERAILDAHRESYTVAQGQVEDDRLDKETKAAVLEYDEQIATLQKDLAQSAIQAGGGYQLQLRAITQQLDALNKIKVTDQNVNDIELARVALAQKSADIAIQQLLAIGTMKDGWNAFWIEMEEQAEKPGKILFDGMNDALNKVSGDLTKLATGQHKKTSFGKDLESVGQSVAQSSMKAILQKSFGALGKKMGIKSPAGKPDGTPMNPYYVILQGAAAGAKAIDPTAGAGGAVAKGALGGAGSALGVLLGKLGGLFSSGARTAVSSSISFMAGGGDADPGRVYGVAEKGEAELISPKNSSRITPLSKLGGGGNTHFNYTIDARGADLGAENRVARAIEYAHNSAVSSSVRANAERAKRTPKRSS